MAEQLFCIRCGVPLVRRFPLKKKPKYCPRCAKRQVLDQQKACKARKRAGQPICQICFKRVAIQQNNSVWVCRICGKSKQADDMDLFLDVMDTDHRRRLLAHAMRVHWVMMQCRRFGINFDNVSCQQVDQWQQSV